MQIDNEYHIICLFLTWIADYLMRDQATSVDLICLIYKTWRDAIPRNHTQHPSARAQKFVHLENLYKFATTEI
jgi:hypothetical protein